MITVKAATTEYNMELCDNLINKDDIQQVISTLKEYEQHNGKQNARIGLTKTSEDSRIR